MSDIVVGIDIGTHSTRIIAARHEAHHKQPTVLAIGKASTQGVRNGYVTDISETTKSIRTAKQQVEKSLQMPIKKVYLAIGGASLSSDIVSSSLIISRADGEVTSLDVEKLLQQAEQSLRQTVKNKKILHTIPLRYMLDGEEVLSRPVGLQGTKLEVQILFITVLEHHFEDLLTAVSEAGLSVIDIIAAPLATSMSLLSHRQKVVGSLLVDIGAETTSVAIFENENILSLNIFPFGSADITNDIALGFQLHLDVAEKTKKEGNPNLPKKKLEEVIDARLSDMFELIEGHLKKVKRAGLLPAGAIITGGGSSLGQFESAAKNALNLPIAIIRPSDMQNLTQRKLQDPAWATAYGLCFLDGEDQSISFRPSFFSFFKNIKNTLMTWGEQFLP